MKQQEATLKAQQEAQEQIRFNQRLQQEILEEKLRQMRSKRRPANNSSQDSSGSSNGPNRLANFEFENDKSEGSIFSKYHFFFSDIIFSRDSFATLILWIFYNNMTDSFATLFSRNFCQKKRTHSLVILI